LLWFSSVSRCHISITMWKRWCFYSLSPLWLETLAEVGTHVHMLLHAAK
jgi:hypothetical protein